MSAPDITIRQVSSPYSSIGGFSYFQSSLGSGALPVLRGEESEAFLFRVYNNFALNSGISNAINVQVTVYDGIGVGSHTALNAPASQSWLHILENGFGQSISFSSDPITRYKGLDTPIGGTNTYIPEKGSGGIYGTPTITGVSSIGGFIELKTYLTPPADAVGDTYSFAIVILYEYI